MRPLPLAAAAAALLATASVGLAQDDAGDALRSERAALLASAAGWHDALEAVRAPQLPVPTDTESAILLLAGPAAVEAPPGGRAAAARAVSAGQSGIERTLSDLGATVTFRYRVLVNGLAVRVPAGRMPAIAALPEVRAVIPVGYMAPAQAGEPAVPAAEEEKKAEPPAPERPPAAASGSADPAHIALIDAGIDAEHPLLGGGIGPRRLVIGGADLVDGDADPSADASSPAVEAHGTQMASLVLGSPALAGLAPDLRPRLVSYRVVAPEAVEGRWRPLARTDRVLAALERAVDPDGDGDPSDRAEVVLLGLAGAFGGGEVDPVAEAVASAERAGSSVVVPAGNDGPTNAAAGSVGSVASVPSAITVGALAAGSVRSATLEITAGPARARLEGLPALGASAAAGPAPIVVLQGADGPAAGANRREYRTSAGQSLVSGAIAVVGRGGAPIAEKARYAADAGAVGLLIWDVEGPAAFPTALSSADLGIPVAGLGPAQGRAVLDVLRQGEDIRGRIVEASTVSSPPAVASFSSRGPTADGRPKPDLVAPGVGLETAWPGDAGARGELTGTSAAAAEVAARALRIRVDRPELGPRMVRSLLIQSARRIPGEGVEAQGAGVVGSELATVALEPSAIVSRAAPRRIALRAHELAGAGGRYRVELRSGSGSSTLGGLRLDGGGKGTVSVRIPARASGQIVLVPASGGSAVAHAPVVPLRAPGTPSDALGRPKVRTSGGAADARVRIGLLERRNGRIAATRLHDVRLALLPTDGGPPQALSHSAHDGGWPAGTYRFLVSTRLASGLKIDPGSYRLRVSALGPDGRRLRTQSDVFRISDG